MRRSPASRLNCTLPANSFSRLARAILRRVWCCVSLRGGSVHHACPAFPPTLSASPCRFLSLLVHLLCFCHDSCSCPCSGSGSGACPCSALSLFLFLSLPCHTRGMGGNARIYPDLWRWDAAGCCAGEVPAEGRGRNAQNYPDLWRRDAAECCAGAVSAEGRGGNARICPDLWRRDAAGGCAGEAPAEGRGGNARICPNLCVL